MGLQARHCMEKTGLETHSYNSIYKPEKTMKPVFQFISLGMLPVLLCSSVLGDDVKITPDVVYGHKVGLALTFDVFQPEKNANGAGVLFMVSGGWVSRWIPPANMTAHFKPLLDRGFTVFSVRHGSSPKFNIPEVVADVRELSAWAHLRVHDAGARAVDITASLPQITSPGSPRSGKVRS